MSFARVLSIATPTLCVIDFFDGTSTTDSYVTDIILCNCADVRQQDDGVGQSCARGVHTRGATVTLLWPNGVEDRGIFKRAYRTTVVEVNKKLLERKIF